MSDLNEWLKERRRIHDAAPRGAWETSSAERDAFYNLPALLTAVEKVLALHQQVPNSASALYPNPLCTCGQNYPCQFVRAVEGAINE